MHPESKSQLVETEQISRKAWETPEIVLERALMVSAQGGPPSGPQGFVGPLTASGGSGTCFPIGAPQN